MTDDRDMTRTRVSQAGRATLEQANDMIRFADVKVAAILAAAGVLASQFWNTRGLWDPTSSGWTRGLAVVAGLSIVLSVLLALYTLVPRQKEAAPESLLYYRHVARRFGTNREGFVDA